MIYFLNASGKIAHCVPESVYQGATEGNKLFLVSPHAANTEVSAAFCLPDGSVTTRFLLEYAGALQGVSGPDGQAVCGWKLQLPAAVTAQYGTVRAQFYFKTAGQGGEASAAAHFTVERGVASELPSAPDQDAYEEILSALSALRADLINGYYPARGFVAWNDGHEYGANEVVYCSSEGMSGAFVRSVIANNTQPPYKEDGSINSQYWETVVNFDTMSEDFFAEIQAEKQSAQAACTASQTAQTAAEAAQSGAQTAKLAAETARAAAETAAGSAAATVTAAQGYAETAAGSASQAAQQAVSAANNAAQASQSAQAASDSALLAQEYKDQAKEYAQKQYIIYESTGALPRPGNSAYICLVPSSGGTAGDSYSEYLWISENSDYEYIGSVNDVDLTNYAQIDGTYSAMTVGKAVGDGNGANIAQNYAKQSGSYPDMTAGKAIALARTVELNTSGGNAIGWYKLGEITAGTLSGLTSGNNNYSAILLVNGNGYAGISNAMPSGIIEIDGRVENGSFNANGYPQIKILAGNLDAKSFCVTCSNEKQEIYYLFSRQYERTFFTVLSETYGNSEINVLAFDGIYYGTSAPSGATYAVNKIYAGFDSAGNEIAAVYAKQSGMYSEMCAGGMIGIQLVANDDLNNCIPDSYGTKKMWYCLSTAASQNILNMPTGAAGNTFTLEAVKTWENTSNGQYRAYQELRSVSNNPAAENIYIRSIDTSAVGSTWTPWEIVTTSVGTYPDMTVGTAAMQSTSLTLNGDLNTMQGSAYWGKRYYGEGSNVANRPVGVNGFSVDILQGDATTTVQRLYSVTGSDADTNKPMQYQRSYNGSWSEWEEIATGGGAYAKLTAGKSYRLAQSVKFSAGSTSSGGTGWYKVATISGNVLASIMVSSSYSATMLINGINEPQLSFGGMIEIDLRVENSQIVTASNRIQPKILCGGISENCLCSAADTSANELNVYLLLDSSYAGYNVTVIDEAYSRALNAEESAITLTGVFDSSQAPAGAVYALNVNRAAYDADGNEISETYAKSEAFSGLNLLMNPDFKINQRGLSSYTSAGYTADRWYKASGGTVTVEDRGVRISGTTLTQYIDTELDASANYAVSLKAGLTSNTGRFFTSFTTPAAKPSADTTLTTLSINNAELRVIYDADKARYALSISFYGTDCLFVDWVKLEKGSVATPFVPPDPTIELCRCQRYFYRAQNSFRLGCAYNGSINYGLLQFFFPVRMRSTPSVTATFTKDGTAISGSASQINQEGCVLSTANGYSGYLTVYCSALSADAEI